MKGCALNRKCRYAKLIQNRISIFKMHLCVRVCEFNVRHDILSQTFPLSQISYFFAQHRLHLTKSAAYWRTTNSIVRNGHKQEAYRFNNVLFLESVYGSTKYRLQLQLELHLTKAEQSLMIKFYQKKNFILSQL